MAKIFHRLLALIAWVTDRHLAGYVEFLMEENKILRTRIKRQIPHRAALAIEDAVCDDSLIQKADYPTPAFNEVSVSDWQG